MKLYLTAAGVYAGTQAEAKADGKGWRPEEVPVSKYELIDYLNKLRFDRRVVEAMADDISATDPLLVGDPDTQPNEFVGLKPSYVEQSVATDEQFAALPLAQKLHYAALALEEARLLA